MFDQVHLKIINLEHRDDRRNECLDELRHVGLTDAGSALFFKAKYLKNFGALGCALSHAMVLSDFLFNEEKPYALILEDDFSIRNTQSFVENINQLLNLAKSWDVFLLGHNQALPIEATQVANTLRVINSQTASGYLVSRNYASKLIETFFRSAELLKTYDSLPSPNKELARHHFCCDMLWKELQIKDRFWATFPSSIFQRKSYSDIESKVVDYGV